MILKVLESMFTFDCILEEIESYQWVLNQIVSNLSPLQVEVDIIILELFTYIAWNSEYSAVINALVEFKKRKNFTYLLEPFVRVLEDSKNIILINNCIGFINVLLSANKDLEKRVEMQESLLIHGISVIYGDIRLKIQDDEFSIMDCTFEEMIRQIKRKRLLMESEDDEIEFMVLNSNEDRTVFLGINDTDEFLNQQQQLLAQIDAFEELMGDASASSSQFQSRSTSKVVSPYKSPIGSPRLQNVRRAVISSQMFQNNAHQARHTLVEADQIQDVDQLHRLFKELRHCKGRDELLRSMSDYLDSVKTVTVVSKIVESLRDNFVQFTHRKDLEQQIDDLQEKGLHLELEISKLSDEKRALEYKLAQSEKKPANADIKQIDVAALREKSNSASSI